MRRPIQKYEFVTVSPSEAGATVAHVGGACAAQSFGTFSSTNPSCCRLPVPSCVGVTAIAGHAPGSCAARE